MDLIKQLGPMAFASRLKRLSERLHKDVSRIYKEQSVDIEARWFPVLYALKLESPMAVTAMAEALRLTHPAINQIAGDMTRRGLLTSSRDKRDERRRLLKLTAKGKKALASVESIWNEVGRVTEEIIKISGNSVLTSIDAIEESLDEKSIYERLLEKFRENQLNKIEVCEYKPHLKKYFKALNLEWLKKHFKAEDYDLQIISDPNKYIIKDGGLILFAKLDNKIVGTVALIKKDRNIYELTKMAVTSSAQDRQVGRKLMIEAIIRLKRKRVKTLILQTSPKLKPAISLYTNFGFRKTNKFDSLLPVYRRKTFVMALNLNKKI